MKFSMNGALTIGTLDGANVEIREEVGDENFFLFGLTAEEVENLRVMGYYPRSAINSNPHLREVIDQIAAGVFSRGDRNLFMPLLDSLLNHDEYLVLADYQSYIDCQDQVAGAFRDQRRWTTHVDPEHGAHGQVFFGPLDPRVLRPHLAGKGGS